MLHFPEQYVDINLPVFLYPWSPALASSLKAFNIQQNTVYYPLPISTIAICIQLMNFWDVRVRGCQCKSCALSQELGAFPSAFPPAPEKPLEGPVAETSTERFDGKSCGFHGSSWMKSWALGRAGGALLAKPGPMEGLSSASPTQETRLYLTSRPKLSL